MGRTTLLALVVAAVAGCGPATAAPPTTPTPAATGTAAPTATASAVPSGPCPSDMIGIPAGKFLMGSEKGMPANQPVHEVKVAAFCIDRTEVTVAAYRKCLEAGKCTAAGSMPTCNATLAGKDDHPINCVDYRQAVAFCEWAGKRLPTEEEWEYAATGTDGRAYPWGNDPPGAQLCWARAKQGTCPVGTNRKSDSPFGVQDLAGNVNEFTAGPFAWSYGAAPEANMHPRRGGSYSDSQAEAVLRAFRVGESEGSTDATLGMRCAK